MPKVRAENHTIPSRIRAERGNRAGVASLNTLVNIK